MCALYRDAQCLPGNAVLFKCKHWQIGSWVLNQTMARLDVDTKRSDGSVMKSEWDSLRNDRWLLEACQLHVSMLTPSQRPAIDWVLNLQG